MSDNDFRIIIIDDNPKIHHDFIKILTTTTTSEIDNARRSIFGKQSNDVELPKFQIDTASQGLEGVEKIRIALEKNEPYALAFVDVRMPPGVDGIETIQRMWKIDKDIQVVICTAYSDYSWEETVSHLGKSDNLLILKKPFDAIAVRQLACALTKKWELLQEARRYTSNLKKEVAERTLSLQKSYSLVKATLESSTDGILVTDNNGVIVDFNEKFVSMWQIPPTLIKNMLEVEIVDYMKSQLINPGEFFVQLYKINASNEEVGIDILKFKNGKIFEYYAQPQRLDNQIIGRVFNFHDVTSRANLEKELEHQATHDALTALPNRVYLLDKIKQAIKTAEQSNLNFALLFIDLDRFKLINDSLSHSVGDELLCAVANRLQTTLNREDTLARLGGDEFVMIMPGISKKQHVIDRAQRLLDLQEEPLYINNRHITISASIGVSIYPTDGTTPDILLRNADLAMYSAKEAGRNKVAFYTEQMSNQTIEKLEKEIELRHALTHNEFFLYYQPQFDLTNEKIVAVEALIRWQHPKHGVLLPMDFIPLAEETGLILAIGEWTLREACKQNKAWQDAGFTPIRVAVNVTAAQFKQQNVSLLVKEALQESKLSPQYLEIELTENVIISNLDTIKIVNELKSLGVQLAIDDFGTGYSSLSYLKKIPLDRLKIDSSFIQHIKNTDDDEVIIRAIIAMAKNLELEVLAEGVETQQQLDFLKKHECEDVQGYYFSKPLSATQMEELMENQTMIKR